MLRPSERDVKGVGCFAVRALAAGTQLYFPEEAGQNRQLSIDEIPDSHLKYCPLLSNGLFLAPPSFARMSPLWYANHDREPNIMAEKWRLITARAIAPGEELVLYYPDLLTHPKNKLWVVPEVHV